MKIVYSEEAKKNLISIFDYIAEANYDNAVNVCSRMKDLINSLKDFPDSGVYPKNRKLRQRGYRMLISDNFLILYLSKDNVVTISAVIHGSRKYSNLL